MATKEFLRALRKKHHLGEFSRKHLGVSKPKRPAKTKRRKLRRAIRTGVVKMARRGRKGRKSSSGMVGRGSLMSGLIKPKGLIASALIGAGTATLVENAGLANTIPYGKYVAGGVTAGVGGVAGVFVRDMLKGTAPSGSSSGTIMY